MKEIEPRTIDAGISPEVSYFARKDLDHINWETVYKRVFPDGQAEELKPEDSQALRLHASGFDWGYPESGASQLALALLLDATTNPQKALAYYQYFKDRFVVGWGDNWAITRSAILKWVDAMDQQSFMDMIDHNIN